LNRGERAGIDDGQSYQRGDAGNGQNWNLFSWRSRDENGFLIFLKKNFQKCKFLPVQNKSAIAKKMLNFNP